ncbi:MAG: hypothetical protein EA424_26350 [Planctomycetaceae bacterium]|nr:MAG: hypothetical protein EA424_26350 [Planctomycetaceae bacterium]
MVATMASIKKTISVIRDLQVGKLSKTCTTDCTILRESSRHANQHEGLLARCSQTARCLTDLLHATQS